MARPTPAEGLAARAGLALSGPRRALRQPPALGARGPVRVDGHHRARRAGDPPRGLHLRRPRLREAEGGVGFCGL
eukprot:13143374-Alexandrium_andersonii.AAC.1